MVLGSVVRLVRNTFRYIYQRAVNLTKQWKKYQDEIDKNDPVKSCPVYLDKQNGSCSHVDGFLCSYLNCSINKIYKEGRPT